jgi:hypothetical protein
MKPAPHHGQRYGDDRLLLAAMVFMGIALLGFNAWLWW